MATQPINLAERKNAWQRTTHGARQRLAKTTTAVTSKAKGVRWLTVAGLAFFVVAAFLITAVVGWFVAGLSCALLDWLMRD